MRKIYSSVKFLLCIMWFNLFLSINLAAQINFNVDYREAATIFDIMDNVSLWREDGFLAPEYRTYWDQQFSSSPSDNDFFKKYGKIRKKYFREKNVPEPMKSEDGLFCPLSSLEEDPVASIFYSSSTLEGAFAKLTNRMSPGEITFLKAFYKHFRPQYSLLMKDSSDFSPAIEIERKKLTDPKLLAYLNSVAAFYQVKEPIVFTVLHTWFPPLDHTTGGVFGNYLILRSHSLHHGSEEQSDIALHEVIHAISLRQSQKQKQALTHAFFSEAPSNLPKKPLYILEEPLAVVLGQMLYLHLFDPVKFEKCTNRNDWYMDKWVNDYAKAIYPLIKKAILNHDVLDEDQMKKLAKCATQKSHIFRKSK